MDASIRKAYQCIDFAYFKQNYDDKYDPDHWVMCYRSDWISVNVQRTGVFSLTYKPSPSKTFIGEKTVLS